MTINQSYCFFNRFRKLGDSAYWASAGINFYNSGQLKKAISVVDNCFEYYAEDALYQQKPIKKGKDSTASYRKSLILGKKKKSFANYAVNDVSMALWTKAVSAGKAW